MGWFRSDCWPRTKRCSTLGLGGSASDFNLGSHGRRGLMVLQRWAVAPAAQRPVAPKAEMKLRQKGQMGFPLPPSTIVKPTLRGYRLCFFEEPVFGDQLLIRRDRSAKL